jgi:hypothetical protein
MSFTPKQGHGKVSGCYSLGLYLRTQGSDGTPGRNQLFEARGKHVAQTVNTNFYLGVKHPVACGGAGEERDPHLLAQDLCTENIKQHKKLNPSPFEFSITLFAESASSHPYTVNGVLQICPQ